MKYDLRSLETVSSHFSFNFIFYAMWKLFKDIALCWMISFHIQQNGKRIKEALKKIFFEHINGFLEKCFLEHLAIHLIFIVLKNQKQPPRGVPRKRSSKNMLQIYRRTPMPKCDFNKVATEITLWYGCFPVNLLHSFRTPFPRNDSGRILLKSCNETPGTKKKTGERDFNLKSLYYH